VRCIALETSRRAVERRPRVCVVAQSPSELATKCFC
jgi:hypothetical protein